MSATHNAILVTIMKNEGPYILEWVAHHRAIGFDKILVQTNHCDDQTDRILDRLDELGLVMHRPNPKTVFSQLGVWHVAALRYATTFNQYKDARWVFTIDVDEFLEIHSGDHRLGDLLEAKAEFDLISFSVVGYNSGGLSDIGDGSVQNRFLKPQWDLADIDVEDTGQRCAVKTLMRNPISKSMFRNHRPKIDNFSKRNMRWVNGSGHDMPPEFTDKKVNVHTLYQSTDLAQVNHHSLRSKESFLVKADRGDAMDDTRMGLDENQIKNAVKYWNLRNKGVGNKDRHASLPKGFDAILQDLHADPVLSQLHADSLEIHRQKVRRIIGTSGGSELAREIGYLE